MSRKARPALASSLHLLLPEEERWVPAQGCPLPGGTSPGSGLLAPLGCFSSSLEPRLCLILGQGLTLLDSGLPAPWPAGGPLRPLPGNLRALSPPTPAGLPTSSDKVRMPGSDNGRGSQCQHPGSAPGCGGLLLLCSHRRLPGRAGPLTVPRPRSTTLPTVLLRHAQSPSLGRIYKCFLPQNGKPVVPNEQLSFRLGEEGVRRGRSLPAALLQDLMLGVHGSFGAPGAQHSTFSYCGKKHMT